MPTPVDHYDEQRRFGVLAARGLARRWARVGDDFDADWNRIIPAAAMDVTILQTAAAITSAAYLPALLEETALDAEPLARVETMGFAGVNRYGAPVAEALGGATTVAKGAIADGATIAVAQEQARRWLISTGLTLVADTGRSVVAADLAQRPSLGGYVRVLNPPSCKNCVVLAGKWFRWNEGFERHQRCDCRHVPARDEAWAKAEGFGTDPYEYFNGLSKAEQDRLFGENDAEAIREGADIYRVANIRRRGLANDNGRLGWQARRYGTPTRMTVDDIFRAAGDDRPRAVQMLLEEGYITGEQVGGGNILGNDGTSIWGNIGGGRMGRGGTRRGSTYAYREAVRTGIRDPFAPPGLSLDSATQTEAEKRLHTAYLNQRAVREGRNPYALNTKRWPLTPEIRAQVNARYEDAIADLANQPDQVRRLARHLGMTP